MTCLLIRTADHAMLIHTVIPSYNVMVMTYSNSPNQFTNFLHFKDIFICFNIFQLLLTVRLITFQTFFQCGLDWNSYPSTFEKIQSNPSKKK